MSAQRKTVVGVIFGGRSVEHDVSVVTGHQVMQALQSERYEVVPIYIDREGRWFTGKPLLDLKNYDEEIFRLSGIERTILSPSTQHHGLLINPVPSGLFSRSQVQRLDVVFPTIHGSHGEDGTLQGLFELADIAYVGCGVLASAIANDKQMTKIVLRQHGVPVVDSLGVTRADWFDDPDSVVQRVREQLDYPVFVKPVTLGSSIGISRATDEESLRTAMDVAANLDSRIMVEAAIQYGVEINCAVMGNGDAIQASVLEQPLSWDAFLTYEEKYMRGGEGMKSAERIIPAPIPPELTEQIQKLARQAFIAIGGRGTARIDFLARPESGEVFLNEINTLPGSLAFYLWQETGLSPAEFAHKLVTLAQDAHADKRRNLYNYRTNLIQLTAQRGLAGAKGTKSVKPVER
jgi:D-alanine-D-alanine ligase